MNIWEILGLQPGADTKAIRAAYAQKAKIHHPEDDPAGFMRLRAAYKEALWQASRSPNTLPPDLFWGDEPAELSDFLPVEFDFSANDLPEAEEAGGSKEGAAFDFSAIDRAAADLYEEEKALADRVIGEMAALNRAKERLDAKAWEALLSGPEMDALVRSEYFAWAFLDFLEATSPPCVVDGKLVAPLNVQLVAPLCRALRDHWYGTALWGEFDRVMDESGPFYHGIARRSAKPWAALKQVFRLRFFSYILPCALIALTLFLSELPASLADGLFAEASNATELLEAHLAWYRVDYWGHLGAGGLFILFAGAVFFFCKRIGRPLNAPGKGMWVLSAMVVCIFTLQTALEPSGFTEEIRADLAAIESGALETMTIVLWLDREHERFTVLSGPMSGRRPDTVYRMLFTGDPAGAPIHFPTGLSPGYLRELAADARYRLAGGEETLRAFEIRYTPGARLVVEATPLIIDSHESWTMA